MAKVSCDGCGDTHECSAVAAPAAATKTKTKRTLSPALVAANAARKAEAEKRRTSSTTTASTTAGDKPKSVVRQLLGF